MSGKINYFGRELNAYRCALHVHTTLSDGEFTPAEVIRVYEKHGFDVLCVTDHRRPSPVSKWNSSMLLLSGMEFHPEGPRGILWHIVACGVPEDIEDLSPLPVQEGIDRINAAGGICHAAHPAWSGIRSKEIETLKNIAGVEIYNAGAEEIGKGYSVQTCEELWEDSFFLPPFAVDDLHHKMRAGKGWTTVFTEGYGKEAILDAIRAHHLYASTGPEFLGFEYDGHILRATFTPCTQRCSIMPGLLSYTMPGSGMNDFNLGIHKTYSEMEVNLTKLPEDAYVRICIQDKYGHSAWSTPFRKKDGTLTA